MRSEPCSQLLCITLQARDPCRGLRRDIGLRRERIRRAVPVQHHLRGLLQLLRPLRELGARPAPMFGRWLGSLTPSIANISRPINP